MIRLFALAALASTSLSVSAQTLKKDIPYVAGGHARQVLDVHAPDGAKNLPVMFWIHGGGWQTGDKPACN